MRSFLFILIIFFPAIINISAQAEFETSVEEINAEDENVDWISYFTLARYRKWEAEGDPLYNNVKVKHESGSKFNIESGISGWRSDDSQPGDFIIQGPDYRQYQRYTFINPGWYPKPIFYKARFRLAIESESVEVLPVCRIMVTVKFTDAGTPREEILADKILTTADLSTTFSSFILKYDYRDYFDAGELPAYSYNGQGDIENAPEYNTGLHVQFKVQWLGNRHIYVDYIEVYDVDIWEYNFEKRYEEIVNLIYNYDQKYKNLSTEFYSKLQYYRTQNEPHPIDGYEPLMKVQAILDSLNTRTDLITHWYPGWNSKSDNDNTWDQSCQTVNPKKLHFWYSPYVFDNVTQEPKTRDFTLYFFWNILSYIMI